MQPPATFLPANPYQAVFSSCGCYRYDWRFRWGKGKCVMFIGLNPSTATFNQTDATMRRCIGFAKSWGYGAVRMVNLFSWIGPSPAVLRSVYDPVGEDNDRYLLDDEESDLIVAVWGNRGSYLGRDLVVRRIFKGRLYALAINRNGSPSHPLFLPRELRPFPYA